MDTRALAAAGAALGLAAGLGLGYLLFHGSSTTGAPSVQKLTTTSAGTFDLSGSIILEHGAFLRDDSGTCAGTSGYDDVTAGAGVTITDQAGTVIATGVLDAGNAQGGPCKLTFTVAVPASKPFYGVQVTHRGIVQFSADQAKSGNVALSLGG